jgi:hypothetical protein
MMLRSLSPASGGHVSARGRAPEGEGLSDVSGGITPNEQLIRNEQAKLTATYFNGLAIALFAVGGLAPMFSTGYAFPPGGIHFGLVGAISGFCFTASIVIHFLARGLLKELSA